MYQKKKERRDERGGGGCGLQVAGLFHKVFSWKIYARMPHSSEGHNGEKRLRVAGCRFVSKSIFLKDIRTDAPPVGGTGRGTPKMVFETNPQPATSRRCSGTRYLGCSGTRGERSPKRSFKQTRNPQPATFPSSLSATSLPSFPPLCSAPAAPGFPF